MNELWAPYGPPGDSELSVPQDPDAERGLVATLGLGNLSLPSAVEALDLLEPSHFVDGRCGHIFGAIKSLWRRGEEVNALFIKAELERDGTLGLVGGFVNIVEILGAIEVDRPAALARRIHTLWRQRRLMAACSRALRCASVQDNTPEEVLEQLSGDLAQLSGQGAAASRFERLNWAEVKDRATPPREWLIDGLVPLGAPGMLVSKPGHGKTWLALQLVVATATGLPCMGLPTNGPCGVVMLEFEDSKDRVEERLKAIKRSYGSAWRPEHDELLNENMVMLVPGVPTDLSLVSSAKDSSMDHRLVANLPEIERLARQMGEPPRLIIVDTLAAVSEGDENTMEAVRPLWAAAHAMSKLFGCTTLFLHHFKKLGIGSNAPALEARMDPEVIRGSTGQVGSARFVLQFGWITKSEAERVELDGEGCQRRYAVLGLTKDNDGAPSPWMLLEHSSTGPWETHQRSIDILATLRGAGSQRALAGQDQVLLALWRAHLDGREFDRKATAQALFFSSKDPAASLRATLSNLKRSHLIGPDLRTLTPEGLKRAQTLAQETASDDFPSLDETA